MRAFLAVVLAGCFSPAPKPGAPCASNTDCPDGLECAPASNTCEKPGTSADAAIDACPTARCEGDMLVGCGEPIACSYGCLETGEPHCAHLAPSNGVPLSLLDGATADVMMADLDFDTDDGTMSVTDAAMVTTVIRPAGVGVINGIRFEVIGGNGIFAANSWNLVTPDDTDATGTPPLVLLAKTTITIATVLDAGGSGISGGPGATNGNASTTTGGCRGKAGRSNAAIGAAFGEGGGGGGAVTAGGNGAPSNQTGQTGAGGTVCSASPDTIPLRGGSGGGHGGQASGNAGGGGGGAIMLVALESITIASGGAVAVPGAGGLTATTGSGGGGGGGSGGAILLEAPIVNVMGAITANGGGGGSPAGGTDGTRGNTTSATAAAGGAYACVETPGATPITRRGGAGAAGAAGPGSGANCTQQDAAMVTIASQGGGGGGAIGRIHIRRRSGTTSGVQSPAATVEDVTFE